MKWYVGTMGWKRKERNEYERRSSVGFYVAHNANGLNYVWREKLRVWGGEVRVPQVHACMATSLRFRDIEKSYVSGRVSEIDDTHRQ